MDSKGPSLIRYQELLKQLIPEIFQSVTKIDQKIKIKAEGYHRAQRKILQRGLKLKNYLVFSNQISFLNSSDFEKRNFENKKWPYFKDALKLTLQNSAYPIAVILDSRERHILNDLQSDFPNRISVFDTTSFEETTVLLEQSKACVAIEGDAAVLSQQLGVPTLVLYGPNTVEKCMKSISPRQVFNQLSQMINV
jgi:ADP-heptose:LPS heptosyltransferase